MRNVNACQEQSSRFSHDSQISPMTGRLCACCNKNIPSSAQKYLYDETKDGFPRLGGKLVRTRRINVALLHGCRQCYLHDRVEVSARHYQTWVVEKIHVSYLSFGFIIIISCLRILSSHSRNFFLRLHLYWSLRWTSRSVTVPSLLNLNMTRRWILWSRWSCFDNSFTWLRLGALSAVAWDRNLATSSQNCRSAGWLSRQSSIARRSTRPPGTHLLLRRRTRFSWRTA